MFSPLLIAVVVSLSAQESQSSTAAPDAPAAPAGPSAVPARGRFPTDSASLAAQRLRRDSALAFQRRKVDSIIAADRAAAARSASGSRARRGGPFDDHTWAFYGNLLAGIIMGVAGFLLRHRDAPANARALWAIAGAMLGGMAATLAFVCVFMFFAILSVGFSEPPIPVMFALSLLATAFAIAWALSLRYRRLR